MKRPLSPARAHFERTLAAQHGAASDNPLKANANAYEVVLSQLIEHKRRLKDIQAVDRKVAFKIEVLPTYAPWVEGVLKGNHGGQDEIVMTVMVWLLDIGNIAGALEIGRYAIEHGLSMPDQYKRSVAAVLAEDSAICALKAVDKKEVVDIDSLVAIAELTEPNDMHDQVRAKLYKAIGYALRAIEKLTEARDALARALQLHEGSGVKKDIERLDTAIKNSTGAGNNGTS